MSHFAFKNNLSKPFRLAMKKVGIEAALKSGEYLCKKFGHVRSIRYKGRRDLLTEADLNAEKVITQIIKNGFSDHAILGEEKTNIKGDSDYSWVIDPIDGTTNFVSQIPHFAISIGLLFESEPVFGIVYDPIREELFHAEKNRGAFLNNQRISVSNETRLKASIVSFGLGYDEQKAKESMKSMSRLRPIVRAFRMTGCASLDFSYVACGRFDIFFHRFLRPWDYSAGLLIVREAGGEVVDFEQRGGPSTATRSVIAGNRTLIEKAIGLVQV